MKLEELEKEFPRTHKLKAPKKFKPRENALENWEIFENHFNEYYNQYHSKAKHAYKLNHLRQLIGKNLIYELKLKGVFIKNYKTVTGIQKVVKDYLNDNEHLLMKRNIFFTTFQHENENIDNYYKRIFGNAKSCRFDDEEEHLLRKQLIYGIIEEYRIEEKIVWKKDLKFKS